MTETAYLLLEGAARAYLTPAERVVCCSCREITNTRDGYEVPTAEGERWACGRCNLDPLKWDAGETVFTP